MKQVFKTRCGRALLGLLFGMAITAAQAAEVCQWKDNKGATQFGDCSRAPAQSRSLVVKPSSGPAGQTPFSAAPVQDLRSPLPGFSRASPFPKVQRPNMGSFPPAGTPEPSGWTAQCESLAHRILKLPSGTPFQAESRAIQEQCPGISYHCEFNKAAPQNHRCGPIVQGPDHPLISSVYRGYDKTDAKPTFRDAISTR